MSTEKSSGRTQYESNDRSTEIISVLREAAGGSVQTLRMPFTGKAFHRLLATAMMVLLFTVVAHVMLAGRMAAAVADGDTAATATMEGWGIWLEWLRRFGAATYLFSIALDWPQSSGARVPIDSHQGTARGTSPGR